MIELEIPQIEPVAEDGTYAKYEAGPLQAGYGVTTVMSTNDPQDALVMPTRLGVIYDGRLVQVASPDEVRRAPHNLDAAMATGDCYTLLASVERDTDGYWLAQPADNESPRFRYRAWASSLSAYVGRQVTVGLRPSDVSIDPNGSVTARVTRSIPGQAVGVMAEIAGRRVGVVGGVGAGVGVGDLVHLHIDRVVVFDPDSGLAIT